MNWRSALNYGFIDIGTNSVRFLLVQIDPANSSFTVLSDQKETIRLGETAYLTGQLSDDAIERAVTVCRNFGEMARGNSVRKVYAVATSATREARNRAAFVQRLKKEARITVHTISGREEARLIYLGVASSLKLGDNNAMFMDIGGGSTELIVGNQQEHLALESLKLGAIRLASLFPPESADGIYTKEEYAAMQQYVHDQAARALQSFDNFNVETLIGSSGTIEAIGDIMAWREFGRPRKRDDVFSQTQIEYTMKFLRGIPVADRATLNGISPKRADIIVSGGAILHALVNLLGINKLAISNRGLRDGLLVDYLQREFPKVWKNNTNARLRSVRNLAAKCGVDEPHARTVSDLSRKLFTQSKQLGLHSLSDGYLELLEYAAILHDAGIFLNYSNHELHSYYLVRNADLLGFDEMEIAVIAVLCMFHRKRTPKKRYAVVRELDRTAARAVRLLAPMLSLAESLDRSHQGLVTDIQLRQDGGDIILNVLATGESQLEYWGASNQIKHLGRALRRDITLELG